MDNILESFQTLVNKLQSTTSRIEKENILKGCTQTDKVLLEFIYNPYKITGISKKKISRDFNFLSTSFSDIFGLITYLETHITGRQDDIDEVKTFIENNKEYEDLIISIVTKDLKLGVQPTTLNKVFGKGFMPTFDVMLAEKYFDAPEKYLPEGAEFTLTTKLDGVRCVCIYDNENIEFFTRQGQPIEGLNQLTEDVQKFLKPGYVYDGELLLKSNHIVESKDLYRATVKETNKDGVKENLIFNIFDIVRIDSFKQGVDYTLYKERKELLYHIFHPYLKIGHLKIVENLYQGIDQSQIQYWLNAITSKGGEGVMINLNDAPYECKRTKNLLKVKKMQTMDLKVVGVEEGTGMNVGRLGALKVEFPAPDGNTYIVAVGGGYTFEQRYYYWQHQDEIIGKIVEVQYFEVSQNEKGGYSLRFPVFKWIREDKQEPSIY